MMQSNSLIQTRRIGLVPAPAPSNLSGSSSPTGFSRVLKLFEAVQNRYRLPLELVPLTEPATVTRLESWAREFSGLVLEDSVSDDVTSAAVAAGAVQIAPFLEPGLSKASLLIWPEAVLQITSVHSGWLRTSFVGAAAVEAAAQAARFAALDREGSPVYWAQVGESSRELEMRQRIQNALNDRRLSPIPDHTLVAQVHRAADPSGNAPAGFSRVIMTDPLHGPMLARMLGSSARILTFDPGVCLLKLTRGDMISATLGISTLLDRLGFVSQAAEIERVLAEVQVTVREDSELEQALLRKMA